LKVKKSSGLFFSDFRKCSAELFTAAFTGCILIFIKAAIYVKNKTNFSLRIDMEAA